MSETRTDVPQDVRITLEALRRIAAASYTLLDQPPERLTRPHIAALIDEIKPSIEFLVEEWL